MRTIIFFVMAIAIIANTSCHPKSIPQQSLNREVTDGKGNKMLLGECNKEKLLQEPYGSWFNKNYADYKPDTLTCEILKSKLSGKKLVIFMGTWCGDSRREVPRIFKIFDYCGIKSSQIRLIMLSNQDSNYKQSPAHEERGLEIHRVPDLIVYKKKEEAGRIIESPIVSLEKDLLAITSNEKYIPNYEAVSVLIDFMKKNKTTDFENKIPELYAMIKPFSKSANELNTYGYVKMAAGEMIKAEVAFRLNTVLYPGNANVFDSLGDYYLKKRDFLLAKENYQRALELEPANEATRKKMLQLQNN
jgi:tetratricopeptide (TPR) repeat protein